MINQIKLLAKYNFLLTNRMRYGKYFYVFLIVAMSGFIGFLTFISPTEFANNSIAENTSTILYLFFYTECLFWVSRFTFKAVILPVNLVLFPISNAQKVTYLFVQSIYDFKILIFITLLPSFIIAFNFPFIENIFAIFLFLLFYLLLQTTFFLLYLSFSPLAHRYQNSISAIPPLLFLFFILNNSMNRFQIFNKLPFLNLPGKALLHATQGNWLNAILYMLFLFLLVIICFVLIRIITKTRLEKID